MREGWEALPLAKICSLFTDGDWIETKDQSPEGIRLVQTGNVGLGEFKDRRSKARFISEATFTRLNCQEVQEGDCLVSRLPDPVGRSCIIPATQDKMITAVDCTIIRFDKEKLIPEWFNYYSQSKQYLNEIDAYCSGATRKRISRRNLGKAKIPMPALPEQKRIVAILDEAFAGIATAVANTEKNLANARELFESYLNYLFSQYGEHWDSVPLEKHVKFIDYRGRTPTKTQHGLRLITAKNVRMGFLRRDPEEFINEGDYERWMTRGIPIEGDVLFTTEAPLGLVCQLDTDEKVAFAQRIISLQPDRDVIDPGYLCYALRSPLVQSRIHEKATGATATGIKASLLRKIHIPLFAMERQRDVFYQLISLESSTQELEVNFSKKLDSLAELKQSLLQKAFSGELTAAKEVSDAIRKAEEFA